MGEIAKNQPTLNQAPHEGSRYASDSIGHDNARHTMAGMAPLGCYLLCLSPLIAVITNWPVYTSGGEEGGWRGGATL